MIASKKDLALDLAKSHVDAEPGIIAVYRLLASNEGDDKEDDKEPVKLLEVNKNTVERGIEPIQFGPDPASGVLFASVVVDVSPREFEMIRRKQLALPHGWQLGSRLIPG